MAWLSQMSLRKELILIIMMISMFSIVATTLSMSLLSYYDIRRNMQEELELAATIVGERNASLLGYAHVSSVRRKAFINLNVFSDNSSIVLACLYDGKDDIVAFYDRGNNQGFEMSQAPEVGDEEFAIRIQPTLLKYKEKCPPLNGEGVSEKGDRVSVSHFITDHDKLKKSLGGKAAGRDGAIYIESDLRIMEKFFSRQIITACGITFVVLIFCYLLTLRLQRGITKPVTDLVETARRVTNYRDYSARAAKPDAYYSTELAQLVTSFNGMLGEIEERDGKLMRKNVELERAKEAAESASISKSQFIANISHELRTPLNAIIGFSSIITNELFGEIANKKYIDYGHDIHDSGVHLLDIINDILDLSKAEAGKLTLKIEQFKVDKAIEKCINILSERATEGEVTISVDIPEKLPRIIADRVRFIQIMLNIMSNAVKFTQTGGKVMVKVEVDQVGSEIAYFTISVTDTGIGMRKEDVDTAFETFGQVDGGLNRKYEGTGLGLPLTKKLVELHNASIRIDSEVGKGTKVTVRFISDLSLLD